MFLAFLGKNSLILKKMRLCSLFYRNKAQTVLNVGKIWGSCSYRIVLLKKACKKNWAFFFDFTWFLKKKVCTRSSKGCCREKSEKIILVRSSVGLLNLRLSSCLALFTLSNFSKCFYGKYKMKAMAGSNHGPVACHSAHANTWAISVASWERAALILWT